MREEEEEDEAKFYQHRLLKAIAIRTGGTYSRQVLYRRKRYCRHNSSSTKVPALSSEPSIDDKELP